MPPVEQTARSLRTKISRHERIGSINDSVVDQTRQRITRAKSEPRIELLSQLDRHRAIEAVTGRDQLLQLGAMWIRTEAVDCRECDVDHRRRRRAVEIHH